MSAWSDIWTLISSTAEASVSPSAAAGQIGEPGTFGNDLNSASSAVGVWGAISGFLVALTDWHIYASLGWILLGLGLIVMGARLWLGKSALPTPNVVPIPV